MKKLVMILLVASLLLSATTLAYGEELGVGERTERFINNEESKSLRQAKEKPDRGNLLTKLFASYYPQGMGEFQKVQADHEDFHRMVKAEREALKAQAREELQSLKAALEAGEITEEVFKSTLAELKAAKETFKLEVIPILEAKKVAVEANRAEMQVVREAIKAQVKNDPEPQVIADLLEQALNLMQEHVILDWTYYNQIQDLID